MGKWLLYMWDVWKGGGEVISTQDVGDQSYLEAGMTHQDSNNDACIPPLGNYHLAPTRPPAQSAADAKLPKTCAQLVSTS